MKCDKCGREVDGPEFPNHYLHCRGSYASDTEEPRPVRRGESTPRRIQSLSAKQTESLANKHAEGMPLRFASAIKSSVWVLRDGRQEYLVEEWLFVYAQSDSEWITVQFSADGVQVDRSGDTDSAATRRGFHHMAKYPPVTNWRIDSDEACALVQRQGGHLQTGGGIMGGPGLFQLRMVNVDGVDAPLWWVPHRLQWFPTFVRADTGALAFNDRADNQLLFTEATPPGLPPLRQSNVGEASPAKGSAPLSKISTVPGRASAPAPSLAGKLIWLAVIAGAVGIGLYIYYSGNRNSNEPNVAANVNSAKPPQQNSNADKTSNTGVSKQSNTPPGLDSANLSTALVISEVSNLRPNPSDDNTPGNLPVRELRYGERLSLLSNNYAGKGWYHVRHQATGLDGWIKGNDIRLENGQLKKEATVAPSPDPDLSTEKSIRVVITPLRHKDFGVLYGAEARESGSNRLLSIAKQVAMEGGLLVVEETQYSPNGDIVYRGKLFFNSGNELVREEKVWGDKRWKIFRTWISDRP